MIKIYKHYIRIDSNSYIIEAFSDAFETPENTDICVNEQGERHYNPVLFEENGVPLFKWVDGEMIDTTVGEKQAWIDALPKPPKSQKERIADLELLVLQLGGVI